jgi:transposase
MDKNTKIIGIDVSKDTFDTWSETIGHKKFENSSKGFKAFFNQLDENSLCVMEYTASYYQLLALFLYDKNINVAVVNPLTIKRFIQMKFEHNKTDKSDAIMIAKYAKEQVVKLWKPSPIYIEQCKYINSTITLYFKQSTALKNKLHSFYSIGLKGKVITSLKRQIRNISKEIEDLEKILEQLIKEYEPELLTNLISIKGIGKKTAIILIVSTNGFKNFENAKQLSAFFGLSPSEKSSGTSVRGRSRITKKGNSMVRNHLFMCSFTAAKSNLQCVNLYNRIVDKGKSKKLALIAICNKLLTQAFAVANSGIPYDPYYKSSSPSL